MSKRSQSSAQPQGAKTPATPAAPRGGKALREYRSRAERERQVQQWVIRGTLIAVAIIVLVLIVAAVVEFFVTPDQAVAKINDQTITVRDFQERVRLERALINERLQEVVDESQIFGADADQYIQFRLGQEPFASWMNEVQVSDQLGNRVLNDVIDDELVREKAAELGITVTDEDVQEQIQKFFEYTPSEPEPGAESTAEATAEATEAATATPTPFVSPTPSPVPTETAEPTTTPTPEVEPTATLTPLPSATFLPTLDATQRAEQFSSRIDTTFANVRASANVSQEAIDTFFEAKALREKVAQAVLADTLDTTQSEVILRHILVQTEDEANDVLAALASGESFAELARAVSQDTGSASNGGEYDWAPVSNYVGPFADAAETAEIGAFVGPVQTDFGYHIIQVRGRRDVPMSEPEIGTLRDEKFGEYLNTLRDENNVETFSIWASNVPTEPVFRPR
jgi:parvulin-like peptidyl-prolyl isomerase